MLAFVTNNFCSFRGQSQVKRVKKFRIVKLMSLALALLVLALRYFGHAVSHMCYHFKTLEHSGVKRIWRKRKGLSKNFQTIL